MGAGVHRKPVRVPIRPRLLPRSSIGATSVTKACQTGPPTDDITFPPSPSPTPPMTRVRSTPQKPEDKTYPRLARETSVWEMMT